MQSCFFKVDIQKAFDNLEWSFLLDLLAAFQFPKAFISWIQSCLQSASFTLSLNGGFTTQFAAKRGVKQGDPLSPLLFVLSMEYLSRMFQLAFKHKLIDYHTKCRQVKLHCLLFADDLLVFCKANQKSVQGVMKVLNDFKATTGLPINAEKSQVFFSKMDEAEATTLLSLMNIQRGILPVTYLGLPLSGQRWTKVSCQRLLDKLTTRLSQWKGKSLSYAGKLELINTILCNITGYWISAFKLPIHVYNSIKSICRNYLWGNMERKGVYPIAWETLCLNKEYGGAGLRDPSIWCKALKCKQLWSIQTGQNTLWVKWINEYYMKGKLLTEVNATPHSSNAWKSLMELKSQVLSFLPQCIDQKGKFIVSKAYTFLQGQRDPKAFYKTIWSKKILPKQAFFLWRLALGRLLTADRLEHLGIPISTSVCCFCQKHLETTQHLMIACPYAQQVQNLLQLPIPSDLRHLRKLLFIWQARKNKRIFPLMVSSLYHIWNERNRRIFKGEAKSAKILSNTIESEFNLWMPSKLVL